MDRTIKLLTIGALLASALAVGGCSTQIADLPAVGLPAGAPERPKKLSFMACQSKNVSRTRSKPGDRKKINPMTRKKTMVLAVETRIALRSPSMRDPRCTGRGSSAVSGPGPLTRYVELMVGTSR